MIAPKPSKRYAPGAPLTRAVHGVTNGVNGWPTFELAQLSKAAWVLGGDELLVVMAKAVKASKTE